MFDECQEFLDILNDFIKLVRSYLLQVQNDKRLRHARADESGQRPDGEGHSDDADDEIQDTQSDLDRRFDLIQAEPRKLHNQAIRRMKKLLNDPMDGKKRNLDQQRTTIKKVSKPCPYPRTKSKPISDHSSYQESVARRDYGNGPPEAKDTKHNRSLRLLHFNGELEEQIYTMLYKTYFHHVVNVTVWTFLKKFFVIQYTYGAFAKLSQVVRILRSFVLVEGQSFPFKRELYIDTNRFNQ